MAEIFPKNHLLPELFPYGHSITQRNTLSWNVKAEHLIAIFTLPSTYSITITLCSTAKRTNRFPLATNSVLASVSPAPLILIFTTLFSILLGNKVTRYLEVRLYLQMIHFHGFPSNMAATFPFASCIKIKYLNATSAL